MTGTLLWLPVARKLTTMWLPVVTRFTPQVESHRPERMQYVVSMASASMLLLASEISHITAIV
ncbi:MAG: hypothetical protein KF801_06290 [Cryobacterium sp.]|nr:hypothetical protein [Cryobacterium sp.]